jgi:hypothetical protein
MVNGTCPVPFLNAALYPSNEGYVDGRLCSSIPLPGATAGTICCLPCPSQSYLLKSSILTGLHVNDIINVIGVGIGGFIVLVPLALYIDGSHLRFFQKKLPIGVHSAFLFQLQHC